MISFLANALPLRSSAFASNDRNIGSLAIATINATAANFLSAMVDPDAELLMPIDVRLLMTTIFMILSIMGIVGNLMVVTVVLKVPGMVSFRIV
jgi:hypothetical protein